MAKNRVSSSKSFLGPQSSGKPKVFLGPQENIDEQLSEQFAAQKASAAYQEMLVCVNTVGMVARSLLCTRLKGTPFPLLSTGRLSWISWRIIKFSSLAAKPDGKLSLDPVRRPCAEAADSGKSTQVPAFLLEHSLSQGKPCRVYCTEPRRISAITLAQREFVATAPISGSDLVYVGVSRELGEPANAVGTNNSLVGYSIRLESNISRTTRLAYVTNGIALRMLEGGSANGGQGAAFDEVTVSY